jgi:hypothetical protein
VEGSSVFVSVAHLTMLSGNSYTACNERMIIE